MQMPSIARKSRWKFSFFPSSSASTAADSLSPTQDPPPKSFICPISSSLMSDPVIVHPGHTFDRACIEACIHLHFIPPPLLASSASTSLVLIPNAALKAAIIDWCDRLSLPHPSPISQDSARALVQRLISTHPNPPISISVSISPNETYQVNDCSASNSKPCYSSSSTSTSSFSSSSFNITSTSTSTSSDSGMALDPDPLEEESIISKLRSPLFSVKESALIALRHSARDGGTRCRMSLCSPRILAALLPMLRPDSNNTIQVNATAALLNLSIDPPANKVKIVRSGAVPALVEALKHSSSGGGGEEAMYNAAGALFSLALEDENKLAIGVLGAIPPLVDLFCRESAGHEAREEAGMALYHLSLASNNLSKTANTPGAVKAILNIAAATKDAEDDIDGGDKVATMMNGGRERIRRVSMMVLASLARNKQGRMALMDADAVRAMVGMMEESGGDVKEEEYCMGVLYGMSKGSLRFRAAAREAGAERVLSQLVSASAAHTEGEMGEVAKEMARRMLRVVRGDHEDTRTAAAAMLTLKMKDEEDETGSVVSEGLVSFGRPSRFAGSGGSASNSANF